MATPAKAGKADKIALPVFKQYREADGQCDERVGLCGSTRRNAHVDDADQHPDICERSERRDDDVLQDISLVLTAEGDEHESACHSVHEERPGVAGECDLEQVVG